MDLIPMVNYASSSTSLSDKEAFPSFLRTVPNNKGQVQLIIRILEKFEWNWIAFIGGNTDYGEDALQLFSDGIRNTSICLAYQEELTRNSNYSVTFKNINMLRINVIIVYTVRLYATELIASAIMNNIQNKVWIASDTWSLSKELSTRKGLSTIGTIIGITERVVSLPGFPEFVHKSRGDSKHPQCKNEKLQEFGATCNQACYNCSYIDPNKIITEDPSYNFAIYSAVYVVAKALHNILHCGTKGCNKTERVFPYKVSRCCA
ncbi:taste receptor type 1 member 1-like [Anguilla rostrata]|uniref:taste receptor type 1 member 1-like n=1 Tax=Anguilla rostrata TaxID=7938 RepID=UPI0030D5431E